MARIDAGAVASEMRWTHPSEIIADAREQVEYAIRQHHLDVHSSETSRSVSIRA